MATTKKKVAKKKVAKKKTAVKKKSTPKKKAKPGPSLEIEEPEIDTSLLSVSDYEDEDD